MNDAFPTLAPNPRPDELYLGEVDFADESGFHTVPVYEVVPTGMGFNAGKYRIEWQGQSVRIFWFWDAGKLICQLGCVNERGNHCPHALAIVGLLLGAGTQGEP